MQGLWRGGPCWNQWALGWRANVQLGAGGLEHFFLGGLSWTTDFTLHPILKLLLGLLFGLLYVIHSYKKMSPWSCCLSRVTKINSTWQIKFSCWNCKLLYSTGSMSRNPSILSENLNLQPWHCTQLPQRHTGSSKDAASTLCSIMLGDLQRHTFFVKYTFSKRQYFSPELQIALVRQLQRVWENCFITLLHLTYTKSLSGRSNIQIAALWRLCFLWKSTSGSTFVWSWWEMENLWNLRSSAQNCIHWGYRSFPVGAHQMAKPFFMEIVFPVHFCKSEQSWISSCKMEVIFFWHKFILM